MGLSPFFGGAGEGMTLNPADYPHLDPAIVPALALADAQRIEQVRTVQFIEHRQAARMMKKLQRLLEMPLRDRMPGMLIAGPAYCGKTTLALEFQARFPRTDPPGADQASIPVAFAKSPGVPDVEEMYQRILDSLGGPDLGKLADGSRRRRVLHTSKKVGLRVLFIDEIHNGLNGSHLKQQTFMTQIKELCNDMKVCIVPLGTHRAVQATSTSPEVDSRFPPEWLPTWKEGSEFGGLLRAFERLLPLKKPSNLNAQSERLLEMSDGSLGFLAEVLELAATRAIQGPDPVGNEEPLPPEKCICDKVLDDLEWTPPSKRRGIINSLNDLTS